MGVKPEQRSDQQSTTMSKRTPFGFVFARTGSFRSGRRVGRGLDNPAWVFAAIAAACIWSSRPCEGQIEVSAYIANGNSNDVSVINTATNRVVGSPIGVGSQPVAVAVTPDGKYVYVTNNRSNTISVIDAATNTVVGSITLGSQPAGVAITPDGKFAYVTSTDVTKIGSLGTTVSVISTATNTVVGSITVGTAPLGVAISADGKYAYVANTHDGTISVINTATNTIFGRPIPVGNSPVGVAVTPNGKYVFVTNNRDNTVSVINTATHSMAVFPPIAVGNSPAGVVITPDGRFAYIANNGSGNVNSNTVSVIDTATDKVIRSVTVGNKPLGIDVTPDGKYVYVTNSNDGTVSVINTATNTVLGAPIAVGSLPIAFGFFVGPNIIVAQGSPLSVASDAALTPLGFRQFIDFNGGTLKATGNLVTSRTISLLANGGIVDTNGFNAIFSGSVINSGSLTKIGAGTLTLSGINTYTGGTIINGGTLVVDGPQALGFGDVILNDGVLTADPQTINVNGNYTQNVRGTLLLAIGGAGADQYDSLHINGHATLGGTLQLVQTNGFVPKPGDQLSVVTAAGGISGEFANFANGFGVFRTELLYGSNSVILDFLSASFTPFAKTPNQIAVANALDRVSTDPRESRLLSFLYQEPTINLQADFDKIAPDELSSLYEISFSFANVQEANIENRLGDIRSGLSGFNSSLSLARTPAPIVDGKNGKTIEKNPVLTPAADNRWGVFVTGVGDFVDVRGDSNSPGYNFTTAGVTIGIDYRLNDHFALGLAGGYAYTDNNLVDSGRATVNSGRGGVYATYFTDGLYLNAYASGGYNNYDVRRAGLQGFATGSTDGAEFNGFFEAGYDFHLGSHFTLGPIASLQYTSVHLSGFQESGSLAPLDIHSDTQESLRSNLGLRLISFWRIGPFLVIPELRASWQHEFKYSALPITAQFASGADGVFTVHGPGIGHDSALIHSAIEVRWNDRWSSFVSYDVNVGRGGYDANAVSGGLTYRF
jgi:YVTN family beta-propeller protein/autotransporter-associated beta strand protein